MKQRGFTLIELLVVISVIAVLSTLTVVYLDTARMAARDARRIADVKQIQLALKMYYNDTGLYPTYVSINRSIANGGTNYLLRVPSNPTPRTDSSCPDQDYQYTQLENGQGYNLTFCLGDRTDDLDAGPRVATHNGILNCPTGWIAVPGSSIFNTNDFCVMKYEAKCAHNDDLTKGITDVESDYRGTYDNRAGSCEPANDKTPVSVSSGYAIVNVNKETAQRLCENIGAHLMTNAEWMTIARNIEQINNNWLDPNDENHHEVGFGYIYKGNYDSNMGFDGSLETTGCRGIDCKRTLQLSDGEIIWDLSANVSEILTDTCQIGSGRGYYYQDENYMEWRDGNLDDYEREIAGPSNSSYDSNYNVGQYRGCRSNGGFVRGGSFVDENDSRNDGIFGLTLNDDLSETKDSARGFRCVK